MVKQLIQMEIIGTKGIVQAKLEDSNLCITKALKGIIMVCKQFNDGINIGRKFRTFQMK